MTQTYLVDSDESNILETSFAYLIYACNWVGRYLGRNI